MVLINFKNWLLLFCLAFFVLTLPSALAADAEQQTEVQQVTVAQAKQLFDQGATFVDTRSWIEMKFGMVNNAIAINKHDVIKQAPELIKDKQQPIVTYCAAGVRASDAAQRFVELGYSKVYVITDAGFSDWQQAGYPTN